MKTTKLLSIILLFILTQSCNKDADQRNNGQGINTYHYLTSAQINQTPYFTNPAFDTISFTSDKGDTLTFVKTKTDTTWYYVKPSSTSEDKDYYQTIHNTYATIKGVGSFYIKHILQDGSDWNLVSIFINNNSFEPYDDQIGSISYPTYKQEITILNNTYYSFIVIYSNPDDTSANEAYINKNEGLFYYNNKIDNIKYTLLKK